MHEWSPYVAVEIKACICSDNGSKKKLAGVETMAHRGMHADADAVLACRWMHVMILP
jgi:hypothetical protein